MADTELSKDIGMFTKSDAEWVKANRKELTNNRTIPITLVGLREVGRHPVTNEPETEEVPEDTEAIVTELTSAFKMDLKLDGGVEYEKGDIWVVIDLDDLPIDDDDIVKLLYRDGKYRVVAKDRQGLGMLNRLIIVGRKVD